MQIYTEILQKGHTHGVLYHILYKIKTTKIKTSIGRMNISLHDHKWFHSVLYHPNYAISFVTLLYFEY